MAASRRISRDLTTGFLLRLSIEDCPTSRAVIHRTRFARIIDGPDLYSGEGLAGLYGVAYRTAFKEGPSFPEDGPWNHPLGERGCVSAPRRPRVICKSVF